MSTEFPFFSRIPGDAFDAIARIRPDGLGFVLEVGIAGDADSFDPVDSFRTFEDAALGLVDFVGCSSVIDRIDAEAYAVDLY